MSNLTPRSAELEDRMRTAALRYFELTGTKVFVIPIANTMPQMFVASGELEPLRHILPSRQDAG
jgi:hypothetical protein